MSATTIRLSQRAPWNSALGNPYRTRWALVDGRMFKVSADFLDAPWLVEEVDHDGERLHDGDGLSEGDWERGTIGFAFTLAEARTMIADRAAAAH